MDNGYNHNHFNRANCASRVETRSYDASQGIDFEEKLVQATLATQILGQERVNQLFQAGLIESCTIETTMNPVPYVTSGYRFPNQESDPDFRRIIIDIATSSHQKP